MSKQMWCGPRGFERWVKAPDTEADFSRKKASALISFDNGRADVAGSIGSHAEYAMSWNVMTRDEARPILDMQAGVYSTDLSDQPVIYFIDPMQMDTNLAPLNWGFPASATQDAQSLLKGARPEAASTPANTLGYPALSAKYTISASTESRSFYIPIPPGFKLWVGFHGSVTGDGAVTVTPVDGDVTELTPLAVTSTTRVNASFSSASGADIQITGSNGDTVTLSALILQVLPASATPKTGGYVSGQGHSGCKFADVPQVTAYSSVSRYKQVGMTAKLIETGA